MKKVLVIFRIVCILVSILAFIIQPIHTTKPVRASVSRIPAAGALWYVEPNGDGALPCLANDPCNFNRAYSNSTAGDILLFRYGTYHQADMGYSLPYPWFMIWLQGKTTHLYGGWDGDPTAGSNPTLDPIAYQSILNGENSRRVITITGAANTSTVAGFLISSGDAEDALNDHCNAMGISSAACGGGIYIYESSPNIHDNIFSFNNAVYSSLTLDGVGGAIYANASPELVISENWIIGNMANKQNGNGYGGGIHLYNCGADIEVSDNIIEYNNAATAAHTGWGAGAVIDFTEGVQLLGNQFHGNNSLGSGTMLGSALVSTMSILTINDNHFYDNVNGYVISLNTSAGSMARNIINNPAAKYGLYINGGEPRGELIVINNIIANHDWGNILLIGNASNHADTAFYFNTVASFLGNDSSNGVIIGNYVDMLFTHGIVANHWLGFKNNSHTIGDITINYNLMFSNDLSNYDGFAATDTFNGDPKFINFIDTSAANFHIKMLSAARDKGPGFGGLNNDIDYQVRPNPPYGMMNAADLGADEFWGWYLPIIKK
jgi:hypothetical protein